MNENILAGGAVTLAGMILAAFVFLFLKVLSHLESRLATWRCLSQDKVRIAETRIEVARIENAPNLWKLPLPPDYDFKSSTLGPRA